MTAPSAQDDQKRAAGEAAAAQVADGMAVGLGTGSTAVHFVRALAQRAQREGLKLRCIPTSRATADLAQQLGLKLTDFGEVAELDLTVDGADEFDPGLRLIKGGGGALLQEKVVARHSRRLIIVCDESKQVARLGRFPLPVEVIRFGWENVERELRLQGLRPVLRMSGMDPYVTDHGHYLLDCHCGEIPDPLAMASRLDVHVGVVEHGLFIGLATEVLLATAQGVRVVRAVGV